MNKSKVGFKRYPILEESVSRSLDIPPSYPDKAKTYLKNLCRVKTLSGACNLSKTAYINVYKWREELPDFQSIESEAEAIFTDAIEESLFQSTFNESGIAKIKALELALKANRPEKYNQENLNIQGNLEVTWLDLIKDYKNKKKEE